MVKNEARWLWYSVTSIVDYVDKVLLWDTGSTDGSNEIEQELKEKFPDKIVINHRKQESIDDFMNVRQEMLDATTSDWFLMLDGDEIWWRDSIRKVIETINSKKDEIESVVVPTINVVGDIFHFQNSSAGRYKFGNRFGNFNLRAVNRKIPGLHSQGVHGVWGWADRENKMIQERDLKDVFFVDAAYLHTTFLQRSRNMESDRNVVKRSKKLKYEIGKEFPKDFYYPESFFGEKPSDIISPWSTMSTTFKSKAYFETPVRKLKRRLWTGKAGY
jgi:glycosyltransferase involved in cell wall biosynthesis